MVDYAKTAKNTKKLIDKNGRVVTFLRNSRAAADPSKPWSNTTGAQESFSTKCSFVDYDSKDIDGNKVKAGDKKLLANAIDNGSNKYEDFEFVEDGDVTWRIKRVKETRPADIAVLYEIQVRK